MAKAKPEVKKPTGKSKAKPKAKPVASLAPEIEIDTSDIENELGIQPPTVTVSAVPAEQVEPMVIPPVSDSTDGKVTWGQLKPATPNLQTLPPGVGFKTKGS